MKRTKGTRYFNPKTCEFEYKPSLITDFHCNIDEYFNNRGERCTFFNQLRYHLFEYKDTGLDADDITRVVKAVTGKKPIVDIDFSEDNYIRSISLEFSNTKVPKLIYYIDEPDSTNYKYKEHIESYYAIVDCIYHSEPKVIEDIYRQILNGIYLLFKNMTSDFGKAHPNYFSSDSTFTYRFWDWKVNKI